MPAYKSPQTLGAVAAWEPFRQSSGQTLTNQISPGTMDGQLGATTGSEASDPTWVTTGLSFDGGDYVTVADNAALNFGAAMTVFGVVKIAQPAALSAIADQFDTASLRSWFVGATSGGKLQAIISADNGAANIKNYTGSQTLADNTWRSFAMVFSANSLTLYVNAVRDASPTKTTDATVNSLFNTTANLVLGASLVSASPANFLTGSEAAIVLLPTALSAGNVAALHNHYAATLASTGITLSVVAGGDSPAFLLTPEFGLC